jgi:hypothetical protein
MNVSGSVALTPNSKVFSNRVNANAPPNPSKAPMSAIDDAEDRRVRPDAQAECDHGNQSEAGLLK